MTLKALPADLPQTVSIDISEMKIGDSIKVKDITLDKVECLDNENSVIIAVKTSRVAVTSDDDDAVVPEAEAAAE
jgi:large subunit ribosomal protein L25